MNRYVLIVLFVCTAYPAAAQTPTVLKLQWKAGQVLTYAVKQTTSVEETILQESTNKLVSGSNVTTLNLTYTWTVTGVDAAGVATLEKRITAFRQENQRKTQEKDGKPATDSDVLDSSVAADLAKMPFLNKVAVTAKVDASGAVLDVQSEFGDAAKDRFKTELPFRMTLSDKPLTANLTWDRAFKVALDPKFGGTGESYDAVQTSTYKGMNGAFAVFGVATKLKSPPTAANELRPLVPMLWEGDVYFNVQTGQYHACKLAATKEFVNHEGDGTKFKYASEYVESLK